MLLNIHIIAKKKKRSKTEQEIENHERYLKIPHRMCVCNDKKESKI